MEGGEGGRVGKKGIGRTPPRMREKEEREKRRGMPQHDSYKSVQASLSLHPPLSSFRASEEASTHHCLGDKFHDKNSFRSIYPIMKIPIQTIGTLERLKIQHSTSP